MSNRRHAGCGKQQLQDAISREFPDQAFHGPIMAESEDPSVYEFEVDNLDVFLQGKSWRQLDPGYVDASVDEYILMNGRASAAFLAAWLWRITEAPDLSGMLTNALVFHLVNTGLRSGGFSELNQPQRDVIRLLLECAAENASTGEKAELEEALAVLARY